MKFLLLPPIVWLASIAAMVVGHASYPIVHLDATAWRSATGLVVVAVAIAVTAWHKRAFREVGTNVNTFASPDKLVDAGLFRYVRNPMYLGFVASLAALAFLSGALSPWLFVVAFFLADRWYIPLEEQAMRARFGGEYEAYRARTRRWL